MSSIIKNKYREALGTLKGSFREELPEGYKPYESVNTTKCCPPRGTSAISVNYGVECCEQKSLINNGGEVVCKFCGQVSHYEMVNEGFIDYYENLYRIRRKAKYQRKYINNVLIDKLLQNHFYLTVEAMNKLFRIFNQVVTLFFRLYSSRKRLLKFNFIFYKIFSEEKFEGFPLSEYKIFSVRLSKQTAKKYNEIWIKIKAHL